MEIYKLKSSFIKIASQLDDEFKKDFKRPYLIVVMESDGKKYAVAMTTKHRSLYSYRLKENQYILYDKCFEIVNNSILEYKYQFVTEMSDVPKIVEQNNDAIIKAFNSYLIKHPTKFSINNEKMKKIQNEYEF